VSESRRRLHGADVPVVTHVQVEDAEIVAIVASIIESNGNVYPLPLPEAR
jgi:hypothetical protein